MYPLKFEPILKQTLWGGDKIIPFKHLNSDLKGVGESWEISGVENNESVVANGPDKGLTLADMVRKYPTDELAKKRHNSMGKTEMWYVVDADKGAKLRSGFSEQITPKEYKERVLNNTITDVLQEYEIHPGDVFFLPAGRVHSIGAGSFIAEIQQTSDITYRIYDFNRKDANGKTRELHTDLAREAINYEVLDDYRTKYEPLKDEPVELVACPYFTTSLYDMTEEISCDYSELDSFVIFICMEGSCTMRDNEGNELTVSAGESILLPATTQDVTITPEGGSVKLLETYV